MKLITVLVATAVAELRSVDEKRSEDIVISFEEYLDEQYQNDLVEHRLTDKMERIVRLRNEQLRYFRNHTKLPETLIDWYEDREASLARSGFRELCPPGEMGCSSFLPFDEVWNYGCWCYFHEEAGQGSGMAMDALDQICKELQFCYRCAKIDSWDNGGEICSPGTQDYTVEIFKAMGGMGVYMACSEHNYEDECAVHTCCCETQFVSSLLQLFFSGFEFENQYDRDSWDSDVCYNPGVGTPAVYECCGEYPNRVPYAIANGHTSCCHDVHLFNIEFKDCCDDGNIKPKGTC